MRIEKRMQYASEEMKNRFVEDFRLSFDLQVEKGCAENKVFSVGMRIKSPYLQAPDESYVNPQSNMGTKQYILDIYGDGKIELRKTESISSNYKWPIVTNDDGRKLAVPHGIPCVFDTVEGVFGGKAKFEIKMVGNRFKVFVDGKCVIDKTDAVPYPGGYTAFNTFGYGVLLENIELEEINQVIEIKSFLPTALFLKGNPPKRVGVFVLDNQCEAPQKCFISVDGETRIIGEIPVGESEHEIEIPDVTEAKEIEVCVFKEGGKEPCFSKKQVIEPARKRTLWMCTTAHEDLGYCGWLDKLKEEMAIYLDMAQDLCDKDNRYRYMIEHMWWLLGYGEVRPDEKMKKLMEDYIKTGKIEPLFAHSGTHTYWNRFEQMVRSTQYARIEAKEKYGIDIVSGVYADTTGVSWQVAQTFAKAGCKYLLNARGPWRYPRKVGGEEGFFVNPCNTFPYYEPDLSGVDGLFYWVGPNGKDKLLIYTTWSYGGDRMGTFALYKGYYEYRKFIIDNLNFRKDYPFDDILDPNYTDHLMPNDANTDLLDRFSAKYAYPQIKLCTLREYFEHMEKNYKEQIPVKKGELGSTWGDYATIDPQSFTKKIEVAQKIAVIEKLVVMGRSMGLEIEYPYKEIYDMLWRCLEFDEHCWATMLPPKPDNVFNNDIAKKGAVSYAYDMCEQLLNKLTGKISKEICKKDRSIAVINTLSFEATQTVTTDCPDCSFELVCDGENIPYSVVEGQLLFQIKMPPLSVKAVKVAECEKVFVEKKTDAKALETDYYTVTLEDGGISGVYDKETGAELIDRSAPYGFNTLMYVFAEDYVSPETETYCGKVTKTEVTEYDTLYVIRQWGEEPQSNTKFEHSITLYKHIKRIDIKNRIYDVNKLLYEGCMGKYYGDVGNRYMDNFFYAFPFNVPDFEIKVELPGCEADYNKDYLPYGVKDYVMYQNYITMQGKDYGIVLLNKNAPCSHLGEVRYNRFEMYNTPKKPYIYSYVASSRMSGLHTRSIEDCDLTFEYSIISGKNPDGMKAAWMYKEPFSVKACSGGGERTIAPLIKSDNENIVVSAIKFSERIGEGIVVRMLNTTADLQKAAISVDFMKPDKVYLLNGSEEKACEADLSCVELAGYDYASFLLIADEKPAAPRCVEVTETGDNFITLSWQGDGEYLVFRTEESGVKPMQYNLVGDLYGNTFTDRGLNKNTRYYYRICSVNPFNAVAFADELCAETTGENKACPAPLKEIRVSVIDMYNLSLTFKISPENDIAYYEIRRGTDENDMQVIDKVGASRFYLQFYKDSGLEPDTVYYYQVFPIDSNGNKAEYSPVVSKKTPATDWWIVRSYKDKYMKQ